MNLLICELWNEGITHSVIKKSFECTGIFPCCREKYPVKRLNEIKLQKYNERVQNPYPLDIYDVIQAEENEANEDKGEIREQINEQELIKENNTNEEETLKETNETKIIMLIPRPSTSFGHILLQKMNKINPEIKRSRKIDSNYVILTS